MEEIKKYNLPVEGMTCASCVARVEKIVRKFEGIKNVSVNFGTEKVSFEVEDPNVDLKKIADAVHEYGYEMKLEDEEARAEKKSASEKDETDEHYETLKKDFIIALAFTLPVFIVSMLIDFEFFNSIWPLGRDYTNKIFLILTTPVMFISGKRFFVVAWNNLKHFSAEMNTLVAIGTSAAYGYSLAAVLFPELISSSGNTPHVYFETAGVIITLILLGRLLEYRAKRKTSGAIKKLLQLRPDEATVRRNGNEIKVSYKNLQTGDIVIVKPGEKIAADGEIINGTSTVDESMLTGESIPVEKTLGAKVIGGTINKSGSFDFKIEKLGDNSILGKIIRLVEEAQGSKAPIQKLADKIAGVFSPAVVSIALLTFFGWIIFGNPGSFDTALINFVAVLIIACPCALGLATPTAIMVGTGLGANSGILIKNGETLEQLKSIQKVILDKTGTITEGNPVVGNILTYNIDEKELLEIASSIENRSEHPLAKAIIDYAKSKDAAIKEVDSFESLSGFGVKANLNGKSYLLGNKKLMENESSLIPEQINKDYDSLSGEGNTVIFIARGQEIIGLIGIEDPVKESSLAAVKELKDLGLDVIMLTGDNEKSARSIAAKTGIEHYEAEVLPANKIDKVKELQKQGYKVAMVGDGINDAPALAQADVGISIGTGTDIAIESGDVTLVKGDLKDVVRAIKLSGRTIRTIKQNLFWAFIYNSIGIPLAALGMLNPMIAALAMSFSSVSVVSNSLQLKRAKI